MKCVLLGMNAGNYGRELQIKSLQARSKLHLDIWDQNEIRPTMMMMMICDL
jgi:hypothetical protein